MGIFLGFGVNNFLDILQTSYLATLDYLRALTNSRDRRYIFAALEYVYIL